MAIGDIQKYLQSKIRKSSIHLKPIFIWDVDIKKYSDSISYNWLLKNFFFPSKYRYRSKRWLKLGQIRFGTTNVLINKIEIWQANMLSLLFINFILNGMEHFVHKETTKYQKVVFRSGSQNFCCAEAKPCLFHALSKNNLRK